MLVSSIVGFNFGTNQSSTQSVQKSQNQQTVQNNTQNEINTCCPRGRKSTQHTKEHSNKLSILA